MELLTKKILITDSKGEEVNVKRKNIGVYLNGKKTEFTLRDLFKNTEFDDGEIYSNSLLGYYNITDDGKLFVAGSTVELRDEDSGEQICITKIKRPGITNDKEIPFEEVQKFSNDFSIEKPEEVFPDLSHEEKAVFIAEREKREATTRQEKADATKALADAETERIAKERADAENAEKELLEKVDAKNIYDQKNFETTQEYFKGKGGKEYAQTPYHIFFAPNEEPSLMIQRGKDWWEEPEQSSYEGETTGEIIIEFDDLGTQREIVLNTETGKINLKDGTVQEK